MNSSLSITSFFVAFFLAIANDFLLMSIADILLAHVYFAIDIAIAPLPVQISNIF